MTLPTINSGTGTDFEVVLYDNSTFSQNSAANALALLLRPFFHTTDVISSWESYLQTDCDSTPVFKNAGVISVGDGTSSTADRAWGQATLTFKSSNGGRGKMQIMEGIFGVDSITPLEGDTGIFGDLAEYLMSDISWVYARDNGKLVKGINYTIKTNDVLRRKFIT